MLRRGENRFRFASEVERHLQTLHTLLVQVHGTLHKMLGFGTVECHVYTRDMRVVTLLRCGGIDLLPVLTRIYFTRASPYALHDGFAVVNRSLRPHIEHAVRS